MILDAKAVAGIALRTGLKVGTILGAKAAYDAFFKRFEKRDIHTIFGEFDYSRVEKRLPRTTFFFPSGRWKLQGYFYPCDGAKGMVVVCHGMHAGADDYILSVSRKASRWSTRPIRRRAPLWYSRASASVVLPAST